ALSGVGGAGVFLVDDVADPVDRFDAPLALDEVGDSAGCGSVGAEAGDGVHDFFGDEVAGQVVDVAADPGDLGGVGEGDAVGAGHPDGTLDDAAVPGVGCDVVGGGGAAGLGRGEDGGVQGGLVALDGQQVVGLATSGDVVGGLALGVGGV